MLVNHIWLTSIQDLTSNSFIYLYKIISQTQQTAVYTSYNESLFAFYSPLIFLFFCWNQENDIFLCVFPDIPTDLQIALLPVCL